MKKKLLSFLVLACAIIVNAQQMTITITGNTVKFTTRVDSSTGTDWTSSPVNLYAYTDVTDTTPNGASSTNVLGAWPGMAMVDDGSGNFSVSVDLSSLFSVGTTINNIKFIYNAPDGSGGYYQNPGSGSPGFSTTDTTHASGWTPVTISALAVSDLAKAKKNSFVANGKLYTKQTGSLEITVYDMTGKIVEKSQTQSTSSPLELNVNQKGAYIVKVSNGNQTETVKFIK